MDKIIINRLTIASHIGITSQEQQKAQDLNFTLELDTDIRASAANDDLQQTIDYAALCQQLQDYVTSTRFKLIETLAEKTADFLLKNFPIRSLTLTLEKKPADLPQLDSAAVIIQRQI